MVERKEYLKRLAQWKDEQVIKVITGIRRCGKSTLLMQYLQIRLFLSILRNWNTRNFWTIGNYMNISKITCALGKKLISFWMKFRR